MLSSELNPEHDSLALIKNSTPLAETPAEETTEEATEQLNHLRKVQSDNVIVTGWIKDPAEETTPETMIAHLRERVDRFETNKHLREVEIEKTEELEQALEQQERK